MMMEVRLGLNSKKKYMLSYLNLCLPRKLTLYMESVLFTEEMMAFCFAYCKNNVNCDDLINQVNEVVLGKRSFAQIKKNFEKDRTDYRELGLPNDVLYDMDLELAYCQGVVSAEELVTAYGVRKNKQYEDSIFRAFIGRFLMGLSDDLVKKTYLFGVRYPGDLDNFIDDVTRCGSYGNTREIFEQYLILYLAKNNAPRVVVDNIFFPSEGNIIRVIPKYQDGSNNVKNKKREWKNGR